MVKGIINAFDHMEFGLVIDLTMVDNQVVVRPLIFATRCVSFAKYCLVYQVANTCYLQKSKFLILYEYMINQDQGNDVIFYKRVKRDVWITLFLMKDVQVCKCHF